MINFYVISFTFYLYFLYAYISCCSCLVLKKKKKKHVVDSGGARTKFQEGQAKLDKILQVFKFHY